jgi:cytochrome P450
MYEMAYVPKTWAKLRAEVVNTLGFHGKPTYEILKDLRYLQNILNEVLRLHPAVPINMRQALEDTAIPGAPGQPDIVLLKGDSVTINTIGMHARKDLYPPVSENFPDPVVFCPDRWDHWTPTPWTYTPFHGGPRMCVGQNFALTGMAFCRKYTMGSLKRSGEF